MRCSSLSMIHANFSTWCFYHFARPCSLWRDLGKLTLNFKCSLLMHRTHHLHFRIPLTKLGCPVSTFFQRNRESHTVILTLKPSSITQNRIYFLNWSEEMTHSNDNLGVQMSLLYYFCFCFFFRGEWSLFLVGYLLRIFSVKALFVRPRRWYFFPFFQFRCFQKRLLLVFVRHYCDVFRSQTQIKMVILHHWLRKGALRQSYHGSLIRINEPPASSKLVTGGILRFKKIIIEMAIPPQIPFFRVPLVGGMKRRWHWIKPDAWCNPVAYPYLIYICISH